MRVDDLEKLLEVGIESQTLDYKVSCAWEVEKFAKDLMAMANVVDGGIIVIGVEENGDGTYKRKGILPEHKSTYKRDIMKDQMRSFADPHVDFMVDFTKDKTGLEYVVITVSPFQEIPVLCVKSSRETKIGLYYRNRDGRPQSGIVSNSYDLRDVLDRAAVKLMQRNKKLGLDTVQEESGLTLHGDPEFLRKLVEERGSL